MDEPGVCRLCLVDLQGQAQSLLDPHYLMMLDSMSAIQVNNNSNLSTVACTQCLENLEFCYAFRQNIINSDQIYREHIDDEVKDMSIKEIVNEEMPVEPPTDSINDDNLCQPPMPIKGEDIEVDVCGLDECSDEITLIVECHDVGANHSEYVTVSNSTGNPKSSMSLQEVQSDKVRRHTSSKDVHKCPDCNITVGDARAYQKHMEDNHNQDASSVFKCLHCPSKFEYKALLDAHMKAHEKYMDSDDSDDSFHRQNIIQIEPVDIQMLDEGNFVHKPPDDTASKTKSRKRKVKSSLKNYTRGKKTKVNAKIVECVDKTPTIDVPPLTPVATSNGLEAPKLKKECSICLKFLDPNIVKEHLAMHFSKIQRCLECNQIVGDVKAHQKHIEDIHNHKPNTVHQCSQCPLNFKYKAFFYSHLRAHYNPVKSIETKQKLNPRRNAQNKSSGTLNMAPGDQLQQCTVCLTYIAAKRLSRHMKIHTSGPQICDVCGATALNAGCLASHKDYMHSNVRLECDICGHLFRKRCSLLLHMKGHSSNLDHACDVCGKKFLTSRYVLVHKRRVHMKITRFFCNYCDKKFFNRADQNMHMLQHTKETPFTCDLCGRSFKLKTCLEKHRKYKHNIPQKITKFLCFVCGKELRSQSALTGHMRIHN